MQKQGWKDALAIAIGMEMESRKSKYLERERKRESNMLKTLDSSDFYKQSPNETLVKVECL